MFSYNKTGVKGFISCVVIGVAPVTLAAGGGTLAAVYARLGRLSDAIETARKSQRTAQERNQTDLVQALGQSIASYEAAQGQASGK